MIINRNDIKQTPKGFRVDKKHGDQRLRKTFPTYDDAVHALTKLMKGEGIVEAARGVTWGELFKYTCKKRWEGPLVKSTTQKDNAERVIKWHLGEDNDVRDFDQSAADALEEALLDEGRSTSVIDKYHSAVRTMLNTGKEHDVITWKLPKLRHYGSKKGRINFFNYEQEEVIINVLRQTQRHEFASLFIVLIETGMRTAEGMYLPWKDVDLEAGIIRLWGKDTKTNEDRRIVLTKKAHEELKAIMECQREDGEPNLRVFPNASKGKMRSAWEAVRKVVDNFDKDFVWYTTRHTCATRLMRAGVDIKTIKEMLGHKRLETTMRYIQFSEGSLVTAANALDKLRTPETEVDTVVTELPQMSLTDMMDTIKALQIKVLELQKVA